MMKIQVKITTLLLLLMQIEMGVLQDPKRHKIALTCIRQTGIRREVIEEALAGNIPKNDNKYKEFLACSYKKQGYQNENGEILIDNVKKFLGDYYSPHDLTALDACSGSNGTTHGENAFNALQCILERIKDLRTVNTE